MSLRGTSLLMPSLLLLVGCFQYEPMESVAAIRSGMLVRAHLTESRAVEVGEVVLPRVVMAEGDVVRTEEDTIILGVGGVAQDGGTRRSTPRILLSVQRGDVQRMERKRLNVVKTALTAGAIAVVAAFVGEKVFNPTESGDGSDPNPDPGPLGFRSTGIRLLSVPLGF